MSETKLHLFNKIYLELNHYIDWTDQIAVIHPEVTDDVLVDWKGITLEDSLGDSTLEEKFRELFSLDKKGVIYCDIPTFSKISATWLKSTTNMDETAFETFVDCYMHKRESINGSGPDDFKAAILESWNNAETYDFSQENISHSIEFLMPTIYANTEHRLKEEFRNTISKFIKRSYEYEFIDIKRYIDLYILDQDLQSVFGGSNKTVKNYLDLPDLSIFKNSWYNHKGDLEPGTSSKISMNEIPIEDLTVLKSIGNKLAQLKITNETPWPYLDSVVSRNLNDTELNLFLNDWKSEQGEISYIPQELRSSILFVFLSYVKTLAKQNNSSELQKFSLK